MKGKRNLLLRWVGSFIICFLTIYVVVFVGGWQFFGSGDPILIEIGASIIFSIFFLAFYEAYEQQEQKIKELEGRIKNLETIIDNNN